MQLAEFAKKHGLKLEYVKLLGRSIDRNWQANHYQCRLSRRDRAITYLFDYSKGTGHVDKNKRPIPPQLVECLDSLRSDCTMVANGQRFDEWANDVGYDPDSRTAYRVYETILSQESELRSLFGHEVYAEFLACEGE